LSPPKSVCDIQEKFRTAIHSYDTVITTTQKLLRASQILHIPIFATEQSPTKLGSTDPALALSTYSPRAVAHKTKFSMYIPEIQAALSSTTSSFYQVALVGIEAHICITQTALDLRNAGHAVYVIADGVSSCNREEVGVALARLRAEEGVMVTTSEGWLYECMGDAGIEEFREVSRLVREEKERTREGLRALCGSGSGGGGVT
jgi:isochorismatase family protein